ncbi:Oidioi.mRNA.OKI2018_I69.chr2.g4552.t1.cds [Oikopleura dioica]|uniref:Oidioi.mRNA.OKI2018_I69.chr2.g4552.t1.cds n=1 Tax=Oikopleura dioica TaxID=34765 RepID=A0ABN7T1Z9_OIKDI|nr:Oidioi.mRNA.OKI2018_I69.chr2.g4552.t1.cds [Oikopleura dioica]
MRATPNYKSKRGKKKRSRSKSSFLCFGKSRPRLEIFVATICVFVLTFFIKLVHNLEKEWAEKWSSLNGYLDKPESQRLVNENDDYQDINSFRSQQNENKNDLGPFGLEKTSDVLMNKLISQQVSPKFQKESDETVDFSKIHENFIDQNIQLPTPKLELLSANSETRKIEAEEGRQPGEKTISLLIPINERGNSSTIIRMIQRQWYNSILSSWKNEKPKINIRFVLASPSAQSKASTLDRNFGDLRASKKRILSSLPLDMLKNAEIETQVSPVDILILLHSSFILLNQDGLKFLMESINKDNTVICLGTGAIQCKDDSVAIHRSVATLTYEQALMLLKEKKQTTKIAPFKPITSYSLEGLRSAFLESLSQDAPGLTFPTRYLVSSTPDFSTIPEILSAPDSGVCKFSTKHLIFVVSSTNSAENREKLRSSFQSDGQLFVGSFELVFLAGKEQKVSAQGTQLMTANVSRDYPGFESEAIFSALNYVKENCHSDTLETVTILRDTMRLNIRRLFREILGPGLQQNDLVCLESLEEPALPEYFDRSSFIWGSNWPNPSLALPASCSTLSFSISSKTAESFVLKRAQLSPTQVHHSAKFLTGIMRHLISVQNITELSISRVDPVFRAQSNFGEPKIDEQTLFIS